MSGEVVTRKSNVSPSLGGAELHTSTPLWWWEKIISIPLSFFSSNQLFYERPTKPALRSYWHFIFSAHAQCLLCQIINSCGSCLGMWIHITLCQFLNSNSIPCFMISLDVLTSPSWLFSTLPICWILWPPGLWGPSHYSLLSSNASGCPCPMFVSPTS